MCLVYYEHSQILNAKSFQISHQVHFKLTFNFLLTFFKKNNNNLQRASSPSFIL